jgi:hypothetical protein
MSRKKRSPAKSRPQGKPSPSTAITTSSLAAGVSAPPRAEPAAATAITAQPLKTVPVGVDEKAEKKSASLRASFFRVARALGSLKLAIFSLSLFAVVLAIGTIVESTYESSKLAMDLVYRTWWFKLLLGLLGTNILFAAVKKWPWKKHQIGFLITHAGLLTMVAGGLLNSFSGTDSLLVLVDSEEYAIQTKTGAPQSGNLMVDKDEGLIRVRVPGSDKVEEYNFNPGSLPWQRDKYARGPKSGLLRTLDLLAHPFPRHWGVTLSDGSRLDMVAYYPHVRLEKYSEAQGKDNSRLFPAVKVQLFSPQIGKISPQWLSPDMEHFGLSGQVAEQGPSLVEVLGKCPGELLNEFRQPPDPQKLGSKGQLVVSLRGKTCRIPVADALDRGESFKLANTGLKVKIVKFMKYVRPFRTDRENDRPEDPAVSFRVMRDDDDAGITLLAMSRLTGIRLPGDKERNGWDDSQYKDLNFWYHPPDYRYHNNGIRGLLQFVQREEDGKLYYRSFHSRSGSFQLEDSGAVKVERQAQPIWSGMNWKFEVVDHVHYAVPKTRYVPADLRPGLDSVDYMPAVRARLTVKGQSSDEFWLRQSYDLLEHPDRFLRSIPAGGKIYEVGYSVQLRELPFELKLLRAEQTLDPGTHSPATYTSYVQVTDPTKKVIGEDEVITMNAPLDRRSYKVYQSGYDALGFDSKKKSVNRSTFTVGHDPGMPLKYAGTFMLAGGIACMFYMRAYFFKPLRRRKVTLAPSNLQSST